MNALPDRSPTALAVLCWILGVLTVAAPVVALVMEALYPTTGMFRNLWLALAIGLVLPAFNLLSFAANLFYARRRRWAITWLNAVLLVQGIGVGATLWFLGSWWLESHLKDRVYERRLAVYPAVKANDPAAIKRALDACAADCAGFLDRFLLSATADGAHRSMEFLLSLGANPTPALHAADRPSTSLRSCEGIDLSSLGSLEVSVARADAVAMSLLLPRSHARGRREAAWLAAQLDRLDLLQRLIEAGVPIATRGAILDENVTLLNAAASGAAMRVGTWLLKEKGFNANGDPQGRDSYPGETPLASLVHFARRSPDSPRLKPFLDLLLAHGADIERISPKTKGTTLQTAVRIRAMAAVDILIQAGASERALTDEDRRQLQELRQHPRPGRSPDADSPDCIR